VRALIPLPITRSPTEAGFSGPPPVDGWGVEMPLGSEIANLGLHGNSLAVLALLVPKSTRVWHPLFVLPVGSQFDPMLGRRFGKCFGVSQLGQATYGVFQDLPWPSSVIEGVIVREAPQ